MEVRGFSIRQPGPAAPNLLLAVSIALWDLVGSACDQLLHRRDDHEQQVGFGRFCTLN
jgi:L-alanine-DL-glutamate epimerase-like enolase superfamily enzyme